MLGQGSPNIDDSAPPLHAWFAIAVHRFRAPLPALHRRLCCAVWIALFLCQSAYAWADPTVQLRIEWGHTTDKPRQWQGEISISQGSLALVRPLGSEADEPGSMWSDGSRIEILEHSPRLNDGADVSLTAPLTATVRIAFRDAQDPTATPVVSEASLADFIGKPPLVRQLDKSGNRLLVRRAPGDMLRVELPQDQLVFSPGDTLRIDVEPKLLPVAAGMQLQLRARLLSAVGANELSTQEETLKATAEETVPASVHWEFKAPANEGVYDLVIEAFEPPALRWAKSKQIAERHVQFVVVKDQPVQSTADATATWTPVMEIDPANPRWYERFVASSFLPSLGQGNFGNVALQPWQKPLGSGVQLSANGSSPDPHWQAYPLSINRPGAPHILEVEYPSDAPQTLGISIVEPNAAGAVTPVGLDSGVFVTDESLPGPAKWLRHRLIFWPHTKNPVVLLTNRRDDAPAVFGKIRVLAGPNNLPHAPFIGITLPERLIAAYQSRPLLPQCFGAPDALDVATGRSLEDWQTFYDSAIRLAEYLNYVGYGGHMLTVMAEGSTIYPSALVEPTIKFDKGALFETAQDPARKDALELVARVFDRERLKLIPALQFSAPLPELENRLRRGGTDAVGIQLIGPDGQLYTDRFPTNDKTGQRRGAAPYYNPLNPYVQDAMLAVVHELVQRYSQHPSFAGLAIELTADGYTQLPGELWGIDDDTIVRFQHDTGIQVPGKGERRFIERAEFFAQPTAAANPHREAWLKWRASKLADFYLRLQKELTSARPDGTFYLAATNLFDSPESQRLLRPSLPQKVQLDQALLSVGIRADMLRDQRGLVLLRPERFESPGPLATQGIDLELNRTTDLDEQFHGTQASGTLFLHKPQPARLPSFDAKSPFGKDKVCTEELYTEFLPGDRRNRQRFVNALAKSDADFMFDGGWLLPMGQEDSLTDLIAAYRRLPAGKFETFKPVSQPVTIRTLVRDNSTYAYLVNDSEWPVSVRLGLDIPAGCHIEELSGSGQRRLPALSGTNWTLPMEPYDLIAVRFLAPDAHIREAQVTLDDSTLKPWLDNRVHDLLQRKAILGNQQALALPVLINPSFEQPTKAGQIPGWSLINPSGGTLNLDVETPTQPGKPIGKQAVRLESNGQLVSLHSDPFPAPATGRLLISVWARIEDPKKQPDVWLGIEGLYNDKSYYRYSPIGQGIYPICDKGQYWTNFSLPIDDLPPTGLSKLQVRLDLIGPGRVWIDDVQVFDLAFTETELGHLGQLLYLADSQLQSGNLAGCMDYLEGYWPRFLSTYVPLPRSLANQQQPGGEPSSGPNDKPPVRTSGPSSWWPFR